MSLSKIKGNKWTMVGVIVSVTFTLGAFFRQMISARDETIRNTQQIEALASTLKLVQNKLADHDRLLSLNRSSIDTLFNQDKENDLRLSETKDDIRVKMSIIKSDLNRQSQNETLLLSQVFENKGKLDITAGECRENRP